jgi:hypothetical protein
MIYDRPVSDLMRDAASSLEPPFSVDQIVKWFGANYPKIKSNTIKAHIRGMTANDPSRHHYPGVASKEPVFFRSGYGAFVRFDPDLHTGEESVPVPGPDDDDVVDVLSDLPPEQVAEFALESQLEHFLLANWTAINWGRTLQIWHDASGGSGHQYQTPVGRPDFVCIDPTTNALVVVELKRGRPSDKVVGQVARYIGWVRVHLAEPGQAVEGLIVAHETDDQLAYAVSALPGLRLLTYDVKFELKLAAEPAGQQQGGSPALE